MIEEKFHIKNLRSVHDCILELSKYVDKDAKITSFVAKQDGSGNAYLDCSVDAKSNRLSEYFQP